jgi:uncharacterized membrane protein
MLLSLIFSFPATSPIVRLLLYTHIAAGSLALLVGLVPMLGRKGGPGHVRAGRVYVYAMLVVAATAVLLCLLQPLLLRRLFLAGVALLSFYLSFSGWRAARRRSAELPLGDVLLAGLTALVGLGMVAAGIWLQAILFGLFGGLLCLFGGYDIWRGLHPTANVPGAWLQRHLTRMGGSYVSATTAFVVVNLGHFLPAGTPSWVGLVGWIAPAVVGRFLIAAAVRRYRPAPQPA